MPTVTLLSHPSYAAFQAHTATISLYESVYVSFSPPEWGIAVPGPLDAASKEWKKRVKMYRESSQCFQSILLTFYMIVGPIIDAFGFSRILFASSSPSSAGYNSLSANWYELAREAVAELGIDQEGVDAIFGGNAKTLYGSS